ncbi:hypothetical protein [Kitasatospora indigofera]|uniref:hypothetical protein n=1 Tax=Kitasatospora indigofera TaxID=67307 RepID=UPI0036B91381
MRSIPKGGSQYPGNLRNRHRCLTGFDMLNQRGRVPRSGFDKLNQRTTSLIELALSLPKGRNRLRR